MCHLHICQAHPVSCCLLCLSSWTQTKRQHETEFFLCGQLTSVDFECLGELCCPVFCLWSFLVCYNFLYMLVRSFILPVTAEERGSWESTLEFSPAAGQLPHYIDVCPCPTKCCAGTK